MDGANNSTDIIDATGKTVIDYGVVISNSVYKYGNGSGYFEGGNYLYIPANSAFDFGTGDFTIDFWADPISFPATYTVFFETGNYILNSGILLQYSKGSQQMQVYLNGRTDYFNINGIDIPTGVWQHYALVRHSGNITFYINGISVYSTSDLTNFTGDDNLYIGLIITRGIIIILMVILMNLKFLTLPDGFLILLLQLQLLFTLKRQA